MAEYINLSPTEETGGAAEEGGAAGGGKEIHGDGGESFKCIREMMRRMMPGCAGGGEEAHFTQEMLKAVQSGDEARLRSALRHLSKKTINKIIDLEQACTALHLAAKNNFPKLVTALLAAGADPNIKDSEGFWPIRYAAKNGNAEVVKALLEKGTHPNAKDKGVSDMGLHCAAMKGDVDIVKVLLKKGTDPNAMDRILQYTPLHYAAKNGYVEVVKALLEKDADPNAQDGEDGTTALHYAAKNGYAEVVKALLEKGADPYTKDRNQGNTALHLLAYEWKTNKDSYKACLDTLLACNKIFVEVLNLEGQTPLSMATHGGCRHMVEQLIYKGAKIKATYDKKTAEDVIKKKFPGLLGSIDSSAIIVPQRHLSEELYNALILRDIELFREILDEIKEDESQSMESVLEKEHGRYTLLMYACENRLTDFVKELLKRGADPSQQVHTSKMNPILCAAEQGYSKILRLLLLALWAQGAQNTDCRNFRAALEKTDDKGCTALHNVVISQYYVSEEEGNEKEGVDCSECLALLLDKKWLQDPKVQAELGYYTEKRSQGLDAQGEGRDNDKCLEDLDAQDEGRDKETCLVELDALDEGRDKDKCLVDLDAQDEGRDNDKCLEDLDAQDEGRDKNKCLVDLDAQDKDGWTALHYAALFQDQRFVRELLLSGAKYDIKNNSKELAIFYIKPSVLEEVLDNCIKTQKSVFKEHFEITFHYSILLPKQPKMYPETKFLMFLSDSCKHQHLLRHPMIDTLLFLKWRIIQKYYYLNILGYTAFLLLLTAYISLFHRTFTPSTDADPSGHNATENTGFLDPSEHNATTNTGIPDPRKNDMALRISLQVLISICTLFLAMREGIQFYISWKRSLKSFKNWFEILIILLTCTVLFIPMEAKPQQSVCAWLMLFSWMELVLLLGRHPYLSIYITMLSVVTKNFLKFIIMFSSMMVAFSISFNLVLQENAHFITYYNSLLKTLAMTTGEIDYTELPLDDFPISSHLLFVAFVFLIVIILMNLLNGLAVSDIHNIQQEAEIMSYRSRVELLSYIESGLLASPLHKIFPQSLWCCEGSHDEDMNHIHSSRRHNLARQLLNRLKWSVLMSQKDFNKKQTISVFPNDSNSPFQLTKAQIEAAKDVVAKKKQISLDDRLSGLESCMNQLKESVLSLKEKGDKHVVLEKDRAATNDRFSGLESRLDQLTAAVLEKDHIAANHRLSGLESQLDQLMAAVSSLTETEKVDQHVLCPSPQ